MEGDLVVCNNGVRLSRILLSFLLLLHFSVDQSLTEVNDLDPERPICTLGPGPLAGCHCTESKTHEDRHVFCDGQNLRSIPSNITQLVDLKIIADDIEVLREVIPYKDLEKLHLEKNKIRYVPDSTFRDLTKLTTLSLADNEISNLSPRTFEGLVALDLLVLSGNKIYEVRAAVFTGTVLPALEILKLDRCALQHIDSNSFSGMSQLDTLSLASNRLQRLPLLGDGKGLDKLINLDASDNLLDAIEGSSFVHLHSLADLKLNNNHLTELTRDSFQSLNDSLVSLSLRGNRISLVGLNSLYPLRKLKTLDLSYNLLTGINSSEPPWDALDKLLIHDNPWDCSGCDNSWLVDEGVAFNWNVEFNVSCSTPSDLSGRNVYENGSKRSIFDHCKPDLYASQPMDASPSIAVLSLVILGMSVLLLTVVFFVVVKCYKGRRIDMKKMKKKKGKGDGEKTSLGYSKMASSTSPFAIGDDDDEQEEL